MINSVLHLLTNRAADFGGAFPANSDYVPHEESLTEKELRDFLLLRPQDPKFYLVSVIASVYTFPEVYEEFKESVTTFSLSDYKRENETFTGGSLENKFGHTAFVQRRASEYPVNYNIQVDYSDKYSVRVRASDKDQIVPFTERSDYTILDWPDFTGTGGVIQTYSSWNEGTTFKIRHEPISYPYETVKELILANSNFINFLNLSGLLKNIYTSQSGIEAIAYVALALSKPEIYAT